MEKAQMKYMKKVKNIFHKSMTLWVAIYIASDFSTKV